MSISETIARLCTVYGKDISDDLVQSYRTVLDDIDPVLVDSAADAILADSQWMPRPAEILREVKRMEAESAIGAAEPDHWRRDSYRCLACQDTGLRTVWTPQAMRAAVRHAAEQMDERTFRGNLSQCAVRCNCSAGDRVALRPKKFARDNEGNPVSQLEFRNDCMVEVDRTQTVNQQVASLAQWGREWRQETWPWVQGRPSNYVPEFETF